MARVILWFKNDLRVHDNYVLDRAAALVAGGKASEVSCGLPVSKREELLVLKI